ncbi:MAG: secretin N-terminal domain-containing protein, partial [Betaproteobacteria bacterium]|nr:secretin N-terminal domain-containing protein [Betaproteobacteria bacterium]
MKYSMVCLGVLLMAACATPPPRPTSVDPAITGEVDKAIASPGPQETRLPQQALLPPLRMEMPSVEGRPIDSRFDLSVSNAPAAQVFMAIASGTRYSMLLNPGITGLITVNLKDVTVREALDSLRELYGHDYRIEGNRIFVQAAGLQTKIYRVNYLLGQRRGTSDLRVQSGSLADSSAPSGPPTPASTASPVPSTGSGRAMDSTRVTTSIVNDFWGDLRTALTAIVGTGDGRSVVVTPQSGVVLVRAFPTELRAVESYLRETRLVVERQVMLEAKVIEVTLAEGFQSGINWGLFRTHDSPRGAIGQIGNNTTLGSNITSATLSSQGITVNPA